MSPADALTAVITEVIEPNAANVDRSGEFPRANLDALAETGLLGLVSDPDVGGAGGGLADAAATVEALALACGSTAMIVCMHYAATAVLEAYGPAEVRRQIAEGEFLATLAFSEQGSRSHFWAPMSTATATDDRIRLDAAKSWVTSAGEADGYVWSSLPVAGEGPSTLWLVPGSAAGLKVGEPFDGLGLRANGSSPMAAIGVEVPADAMLGPDGGGLDVMLGVVLPWFSVLERGLLRRDDGRRGHQGVPARSLNEVGAPRPDARRQPGDPRPPRQRLASPPTRYAPCWPTPSRRSPPVVTTPRCGCSRSRRPPPKPRSPSPTPPCGWAGAPRSARRSASNATSATPTPPR